MSRWNAITCGSWLACDKALKIAHDPPGKPKHPPPPAQVHQLHLPTLPRLEPHRRPRRNVQAHAATRRTVTLNVANSGDRPIQVGSHYHFFETNDALTFDRALSRGMRLNIPAGTAVRFEPGQSREVELVELAGLRRVFGFAGRIMGDL